MTFIGIDIGTTRTKALLHATDSAARRIVAESTPTVTTPLGDFRDAEAVFATVVHCLGTLAAQLTGDERAGIEGIGVTSLSEEVVLVDATGLSAGAMPAWYTRVAADGATALGIDTSFSWSKLAWAFDQVASTDSAYLDGLDVSSIAGVTTLNSYVVGRLAGVYRVPIDQSHASRSGFFDVRSAEWVPKIFQKTGWDASLLPALVETGTVVATIDDDLAARLGIPLSTAIALAGHDHFCGAFGNGVRHDGQLYVSAGTSEAHCLILDELPSHPLPPFVGVGRYVDGRRFYLHRQLSSGHLYRQWTGLLGLDTAEAHAVEAELLLGEPVGSRGTTIVPGFDGDTSSSLLHVAAGSSAHTLLRALLEGLACAALHIDRELVTFTSRPIERIVAAGIPCQSPFWQELRGQLTAAPLFISDEEEAPALGAAVLCQIAVRGEDAPAVPPKAARVDPRLASEYDALYSRFESEWARLLDSPDLHAHSHAHRPAPHTTPAPRTKKD